MSTEPNACGHCGVPESEHLQRWKVGPGWHTWTVPTDEQRKARMLARAAERRPAAGMPHTPAQEASVCFAPYGNTATACRVTIPKRMSWNFATGDWGSPALTTRRAEATCTRCLAEIDDEPEPDLSLIPADLIVRDPEICSGRPTMRGTRILASRIAGELAAGTSWELLYEWYPSMPVPPAQPGAGDAETSGTGSGRGTGEPRLQISTQGIDGEPLTGPEIISRTLVLAFGTRHHGRAFIREIADALDAALRPVHEAAAPDVDGWTLHARPGGLQVSHDTDADMPVLLHDQHLPLGAVLAFIADLDEEAGR